MARKARSEQETLKLSAESFSTIRKTMSQAGYGQREGVSFIPAAGDSGPALLDMTKGAFVAQVPLGNWASVASNLPWLLGQDETSPPETDPEKQAKRMGQAVEAAAAIQDGLTVLGRNVEADVAPVGGDFRLTLDGESRVVPLGHLVAMARLLPALPEAFEKHGSESDETAESEASAVLADLLTGTDD